MPFVVEHQIIHLLAGGAQALDHVARLGLDHARVVLALDDEQRAADLIDVGAGRALDQEVVVPFRVADGDGEVLPPWGRDAVLEVEQVVGAEQIDGGAPQLGMAAGQGQGHVAAVRAADHGRARDVEARVLRQHLRHRMHVVQPVLAAPVVVRRPSNDVNEASSPAESHSSGRPSARSRVCWVTWSRAGPATV